ncbi:TPA: hypothetical protein U2B98_002140 [Streptococcus suis]|uniref:hypothetical protein n=1 Tax=Streptococcus suis TaxID=1307 RepID=UPI0013752CE6|nr:hypothetical protein [Streptococcus suis]MBY4985753.1 hypothetical protein [Streptococcus suis]MBY5038933.1 hypothetical protein [Streptococcus suis]MCQ8260150.1 hypothetical protein [Streptococcus suis]MDW8759896.1 hypothetical protein [Streptococcus suis]HEM2809629.1 hypothetical protein [Streptococcus suis]
MGYDTDTRRVRNDKETGAIAIGEINPAGGVKITTMLKPDEGGACYDREVAKDLDS